MLTRAEIKEFKCLHEVTAEIGPFNVLIGPNDSGKTSFLQALGWAARLGNRRPYVPAGATNVAVNLTSDDADLALRFVSGGWIVNGVPNNMGGIPIEFRNVTDPIMLEPVEIASPSPKGSGALSTLIGNRGRGATAHLARCALGDRGRYDAIQKGMRDVTNGRVRELVVGEDPGAGYPLSFRLYDDTIIPASEVSQGLLVYFAFLTIVHRDDPPAVLLVEEPENGVHPLRLHEIVRLLRTLTERGVQIVMTTHSPDLLNACKPEEVLVFRRPNPEAGTEITRLPSDFSRRAMRSTMGEIWASSGEEGLLDMIPAVEPRIKTEQE